MNRTRLRLVVVLFSALTSVLFAANLRDRPLAGVETFKKENFFGSYPFVDKAGNIEILGYHNVNFKTSVGILRVGEKSLPEASFAKDGLFTFPSGNLYSYIGEAAAEQSDGKHIYGGVVSAEDADILVFRLNQNGTLDTTFGEKGALVYDFELGSQEYVYSLAVDAKDQIWVTGACGADALTVNTPFIAKLAPSGKLDVSFQMGGLWKLTEKKDLQLLWTKMSAKGLLVYLQEGVSSRYMLRLDSKGELDKTFGVDGKLAVAKKDDLFKFSWPALDKDGNIYFAGDVFIESDSDLYVSRFTEKGRDLAFGVDGAFIVDSGLGSNDGAMGILIDGKGRVLVASASYPPFDLSDYYSGNEFDLQLYRLDHKGRLDTSFGNRGVVSHQADFNMRSYFRMFNLPANHFGLFWSRDYSSSTSIGRFSEDGHLGL